MIELWNVVLLEPMINGLLAISMAFGGSFGLAIIILTIIINLIILPLTLRQLRSTKAMQSMQPKIQDLQKKYAKDKQKLQEETVKVYKESGINPLGCAFPLLIQMPIWIALYQSVMQTLATTPERLLGLSNHLYSWGSVQQAIPPESNFLGMNLAYPNLIITIFIMASMWLTQKMSTTPAADPKQQQTQNMMQWLLPIMFGFIFLNFPSGLALYIVVMNIFRMIVQYFVMGGWGGLATLIPGRASTGSDRKGGQEWAPPKKGWAPSSEKTTKEIEAAEKKAKITTTGEEGNVYGRSGIKRKKRR